MLTEWLIILGVMGLGAGLLGLGVGRLHQQSQEWHSRLDLVSVLSLGHMRAAIYRVPQQGVLGDNVFIWNDSMRIPFYKGWGMTGVGRLGFTPNGTTMVAGSIKVPYVLLSVGVGWSRLSLKGGGWWEGGS